MAEILDIKTQLPKMFPPVMLASRESIIKDLIERAKLIPISNYSPNEAQNFGMRDILLTCELAEFISKNADLIFERNDTKFEYYLPELLDKFVQTLEDQEKSFDAIVERKACDQIIATLRNIALRKSNQHFETLEQLLHSFTRITQSINETKQSLSYAVKPEPYNEAIELLSALATQSIQTIIMVAYIARNVDPEFLGKFELSRVNEADYKPTNVYLKLHEIPHPGDAYLREIDNWLSTQLATELYLYREAKNAVSESEIKIGSYRNDPTANISALIESLDLRREIIRRRFVPCENYDSDTFAEVLDKVLPNIDVEQCKKRESEAILKVVRNIHRFAEPGRIYGLLAALNEVEKKLSSSSPEYLTKITQSISDREVRPTHNRIVLRDHRDLQEQRELEASIQRIIMIPGFQREQQTAGWKAALVNDFPYGHPSEDIIETGESEQRLKEDKVALEAEIETLIQAECARNPDFHREIRLEALRNCQTTPGRLSKTNEETGVTDPLDDIDPFLFGNKYATSFVEVSWADIEIDGEYLVDSKYYIAAFSDEGRAIFTAMTVLEELQLQHETMAAQVGIIDGLDFPIPPKEPELPSLMV